MPDREALSQMYGGEYASHSVAAHGAEDPRDPLRVIQWLKQMPVGTFLDYGCGTGSLLVEAMKLNWQAIGVEFDDEVARELERSTAATVITNPNERFNQPLADILNLGDVIEHLTELNRQMREILKLIRPGGLLIAQGPLEANANLFNLTVRLSRSFRRSRRIEMAPYHVLLATAEGQRALFQRFGLTELEYSIREVAWPAPGRCTLSDLFRPRVLGLFALRRLSQMISGLQSRPWGNRYFYVGRWNG
jgi:SAM-dependent methyltransferase